MFSDTGSIPDRSGIVNLYDWYAYEDSWLDWVLKQVGHPLFDALVQE
jgi:hypothetical protein